jgi:hypothetical protein
VSVKPRVSLPALAVVNMAIAASGCAGTGGNVPARLLAADAACIDEIADFAARQTGRRVMLSPSVFGETDELVLTRGVPRGADGRPLDGRTIGAPVTEVFRLKREGRVCTVTHEASGVRHALEHCNCAPLR